MRDSYEQLHKKNKVKTDHGADQTPSPADQFTQPPSRRTCTQKEPD